jgi:hypothetical protein
MFGLKRDYQALSHLAPPERIDKRSRSTSAEDYHSNTPNSCCCRYGGGGTYPGECSYCYHQRCQNDPYSNELVQEVSAFQPFESLENHISKRGRGWEEEEDSQSHGSKRAHSEDTDLNRIRLPDAPASELTFPSPDESNSDIDYRTSNYSLKQLHLERLNRRIAAYSSSCSSHRSNAHAEENSNDML